MKSILTAFFLFLFSYSYSQVAPSVNTGGGSSSGISVATAAAMMNDTADVLRTEMSDGTETLWIADSASVVHFSDTLTGGKVETKYNVTVGLAAKTPQTAVDSLPGDNELTNKLALKANQTAVDTLPGDNELTNKLALKATNQDIADTLIAHPGPYDYTIEKIGSTNYARPGKNSGLQKYSNADLATVINLAVTALGPRDGGDIYIDVSVKDTIRTSIIDNGVNNVRLIFGFGSKLIAKKNLMTTGSDQSVIHLTSASGWRIIGVHIDGNAVNQTVDTSPDQSGVWMQSCVNCIVSDANIHDMRIFGVFIGEASVSCGVMNSTFTVCNWNAITLGNHNTCSNLWTFNNDISHCGDVGISSIGTKNKILYDYIHDNDGVLGDPTFGAGSSNWGLAVEYVDGSNETMIKGVRIEGGGVAISIAAGCLNTDISYVRVRNNSETSVAGSFWIYGAKTRISHCNLYSTDPEIQGVIINANDVTVESCDITADQRALRVEGADRANLKNNTLTTVNDYALYIADAASEYTRVFGIDFDAAAFDVEDNGTGTIYGEDNIYTNGSVGRYKRGVTTTSGGLTTGILLTAFQHITVTSASADYIVCLPAASVATVNATITGTVGANGFELRPQAAQATTVYINGVTTNVEAAIPASSTFEIKCIDATHWILKVWDANGAYSAPVPDAV